MASTSAFDQVLDHLVFTSGHVITHLAIDIHQQHVYILTATVHNIYVCVCVSIL